MPNKKMVGSILKEYGVGWVVSRILYSAKLKIMSTASFTENFFEKKTAYPKKLDLFKIDVEAIRELLRGLTEEDKLKLVETADKACEGIINGFSSIELNYGNPLDWQMSPLTGQRCDKKEKWYKIPDFDQKRGDIKVIWEASRLSHFIALARAYLLTDDSKYYQAFSTQLADWLVQNPYGRGANFKCGQECSLRMVNTLLAFAVFKRNGIATDVDNKNVLELIDRCYRKVLSNFFYAYRCIKNNHTISELLGMVIGAWSCDDQRCLDKAFTLLDKVIDEQFSSDGGYRQFSFNYQRLALQDLECVLSIEKTVGRNLSKKSKDKIKNAAWLMYQCQDESGDMPNYGSNDGALVFPVTSCGYRDFRPVINTAYALTTGKQLYDAGKHQEELLWFSAGKPLQTYMEEKQERSSYQFVEAGLFTIRVNHSWGMIVLNDYQSRPAHMDQNHFDLWIGGVNVLCDAGTFSYASDFGRRLVSNESHNTVFIKDKNQMNSSGPFMIYDWTRRELGRCDTHYFEGKMVSSNGYSHIRKVEQTDSSYEISDTVDIDCNILFHTPCEACLENGKVILKYENKKICVISSSGKMELLKGERSLFYLKREETTCIAIMGQAGVDVKTKVEIVEGD